MKIGYARISMDDQALDLMRDALTRAGCEKTFEDAGISGEVAKRPGLDAALAAVGPGDVLTVWRLDHLGRSLRHLIDTVGKLEERGAGFASLTENIDTTTPSGILFFHLMAALAQFERSVIIDRVNAGIAAAKKRGKHLGRPSKLSPEQVAHARRTIDQGLQTPAGMAEVLGVNHSTLWRAMRRNSRAA